MKVSSTEKNTGLEKSIRIDNAISRFENEQMEQAKERVQGLFEDTESRDDQQLKRENTKAHALMEKAQRLMKDASEDDREDLVDLIENVNDALESGDETILQEAMDQLSDLIFYLETKQDPMEHCPNCRARHRGVDICPRCGMELGRILQIDALVRRMENTALQLLLERDPYMAEIILHRVLELHASPMTRILLGFIGYLKQHRLGKRTK